MVTRMDGHQDSGTACSQALVQPRQWGDSCWHRTAKFTLNKYCLNEYLCNIGLCEERLLKCLSSPPCERCTAQQAQHIPKSMDMRVTCLAAAGSLQLETAVSILEVEPNIIRDNFLFMLTDEGDLRRGCVSVHLSESTVREETCQPDACGGAFLL